MDFSKELLLAKKLAKESGDYLWDVFMNNLKINYEHKSKHEIVTKYDYESEKMILGAIKKKFPTHQFLSEEAGLGKNKNSDYLWVIDPLDGTTNFSSKNPLFGVSIALLCKNKIVLGVIYIPFSKELFWAEKGKGAYLNNKRIAVSNTKDLKKAFLAFCYGYKQAHVKELLKIYNHFKLNSFETRHLGSAVVEFTWVACGRIDSIMIKGTNPWDVASGALIVREAGGRVTNYDNQEWNINDENILGSNGLIHSKILKALKNI